MAETTRGGRRPDTSTRSVMQSTPGVLATAHRDGVTTRDPAQIVHPGDEPAHTEVAVHCLSGNCPHCEPAS